MGFVSIPGRPVWIACLLSRTPREILQQEGILITLVVTAPQIAVPVVKIAETIPEALLCRQTASKAEIR
jgi:hypothetical protein